MAKEGEKVKKERKRWNSSDVQLFILAILGVFFLAVFAYAPAFGLVLAFKEDDGTLDIIKQLTQSNWDGFNNFKVFLTDKDFLSVLWNTLGLNLLQLVFNFPAPIIFALFLNEVRHKKVQKGIQIATYFPYFISWVAFGGCILALMDTNGGLFNTVLLKLHIVSEPIDFGQPQFFWSTIIITSIIKGVGWGSIIYIAAIAGIDKSLYEAAEIDGAGRWSKSFLSRFRRFPLRLRCFWFFP